MIVLSTLSTKLISGVINLLALNLCTASINYDLPSFPAINQYLFSYFEKEMETDIASIFIQNYVSFSPLHFS